MRWGVPDDEATTETLRTQLVAITEAERQALSDASHYIAASSDLSSVQRLAGAVLTVANRGGVLPPDAAQEPWCPEHGYGCEPSDCPCGHSLRCDCREIAAYEH